MKRTPGNAAAWFEATGKTIHEPKISTGDRINLAFERASARKKPGKTAGSRVDR